MVAIVTGQGLGLERSSANQLGSRGTLGSAFLGRANDGVTVNAATGNLIIQGNDEILIGRGPDAVISRSYNSLGDYTNLAGTADTDNWLYNSQRKIKLKGTANAAGSYATLTDWDGSVVTFAFVSTTAGYRATENPYRDDILTLASNVWTWTEGKSRRVEKFANNIGGRITESADADGNKIRYGYDAATTTGKLTTITTQNVAGQTGVTTFTYSGTNVASVVTSYNDGVNAPIKTLTRVRYTYDTSNRLTSVTTDLSPDDNTITDGRVYTTSYTYDGTSKRVASIAQTDGSLLSFTYDGSNRVASFTQTVESGVTRTTTFGYTASSTSITDPQGNITYLTFDAAGRLTTRQDPAPVSGGSTRITDYYYNANGDVISEIVYDSQASRSAGTPFSRDYYSYDTNGNLLDSYQVNDGGYIVTRYTYGSFNQLLTSTRFTGTDPDGYGGVAPTGGMETRYIYDDAGVASTAGYNDDGTSYTNTDSAAITADKFENHVRFVLRPFGTESRVTEYSYNAFGEVIAEIDYAGNLYTGTVYTEKALADWVALSTTDKAQALRKDTTYDFRGNIATVTSYEKTNSTGVGITSAGNAFTRATYVYDQFGKLLSKLTNDATATETYAYDGLGRVIRFTDKAGIGTWTTYIDAQARTVVTLANGLTHTSSYNRAGELAAFAEARGGMVDENLATDLSGWANSNIAQSAAGTLAGVPAQLFTINQTGVDTRQSSPVYNMVQGDALSIAISLKGSGAATTHAFAIYGYSTGWSSNNISSARIISGPGTLQQTVGGLWTISGLSNTEETRIEITRLFTQSEQAAVWIAVDYPGGYRAGYSVIASAPIITRSRYDTSFSGGSFIANHFSLNGINTWGMTASSAGIIGGSPATQYTLTTPPVGDASGMQLGTYNANAGDTFTHTVYLQGTATSTSANLGFLGSTDGWSGNADAWWAYGPDYSGTARIISGPGAIVQSDYGFWSVTGLVAGTPTRIEINRTFTKAESGDLRIYPDGPQGARVGVSLIIAGPSMVRTPGSITSYKYDNLGRLRITVDPVGARSFYFYDRTGRQIGMVDGDGSVTEYKFDAADRVIATVRYATALTAAQVADLSDGNGNPSSVEFATVKTQVSVSTTDRWNWNIYDKAGRLIQTIDAAGAVQRLEYDGANRLVTTTRYYNTLASTLVDGANGISGYRTTPPIVLTLPTPYASYDRIVRNFYDNDGLLQGTLDEEGFLKEVLYDKAGRAVETVAWANAATATLWAAGTLAQLKASITPDSNDIHTYTLYDGRGLVVATVDGEGNVTRYSYTAAGDISQEIRGYIITVNPTNVATAVAAATGTHLEITNYSYNARRELISRVRLLSGSNTETTLYTYSSIGKLLTQTTSETVSTETRTNTNRYDAKGRLIATLGGIGSWSLSTYGPNPTVAQIDGQYAIWGTHYQYDAADRLIAQITPDGSGGAGYKTLYYYDRDGQLRYEINALGEVMEYRYNALEDRSHSVVYATRLNGGTLVTLTGGLLTTAIKSNFDAIAQTATTVAQATSGGSQYDSSTRYAYTNRGELNFAYNPLYDTAPSVSNYSQFGYSSFGELGITYEPTDTAGSHWNVTNHSYYRRGLKYYEQQLLNGTALGSLQTTYDYDAFGRVVNRYDNFTDYRGESYNYDRANRLINIWEGVGNYGSYAQTLYDPRNNVISSRDRNGKVTTFAYDLFNRTVTTTTAENIQSSVKKNAYGQTILITDGAGRTTSYTYDKNGNLKTVADAAGMTTNVYDSADRLIETIDGRGVKTRFTYDAVGRVLTEVRDDGGIGATTTYEYDAKGQQTRITDARGVVTDLTYDLKGQKLTVTQDVGGLAIMTKYNYRADGKVSRMTEAQGKPEQRITDYKYDTMGRLLEEIVDPSGLNLSTKYSYDVNNNLVSITDARNNVTRLVYDTENRQILSVSPQGEVVETGYDAEGRAISNRRYVNRIAQATVDGFALEVAESTVRASFPADASRDQISRTIYDGDGRRAYAIDGEGYVTRFKYDGANNILKTVVYSTIFSTATNTTTKANLDAAFGTVDTPPATASVTTFTYDNANRLTSTTDAEGFTESYEYDSVGNRTKLTNKLNGITSYTFDNLNRVRTEYVNALIYNEAGIQTASGYYKNQYEYDALGNVTRQVEGNIGLLATYGAAHTATARGTKFEYDKLGRLTKKTQDTFQTNITPIETFAYDAHGNLVLYTDPSLAKTYTYYDADNRKVASISQINATQGTYQSWSYDGTGNVVSEKTWGTLVTVPSGIASTPPTVPGGEYRETTFEYDRNGALKKRNIASIRTGSWNGASYVSNAGQTLTVESIFDAFGNLVQEIDANNNVTSHWFDRNGRETAKVDANLFLTKWTRDEDGNVTWERRYATALASAPSASGAAPSVADHADDRITTFAYDKNGRRLSETRVGMLVSTFSGNNDTPSIQNAIIGYTYNGLGEVMTKTEANGDVFTYNYDTQGRLSWQRNAVITDYNDNSVHRRTLMFYDALGNLVMSNEQAVDVNNNSNYAPGYSSANDRYTRYGYDKGRLTWTTDAMNFTRNSKYDVNSRIVEEFYTRYKADGVTAVQEAILTSYDLGGRLTQTRTAQWISGAWIDQAPAATLTYNAYGEVSTKSLDGVLQEQFQYDLAGRVVKSTAGDGIWKLFGYDANGNATITATSAGANLSGYADIGAVLAANVIGNEDVNASYVVYDKRNMAAQTVEEGRRLTATGALANLTSSRAYNAFGEVTGETDARNNTTNYAYNAMGRVTKVKAPTVSVTSESGVVSNLRPTQLYYYDIAGRQIGTRDANLYLTTRTLLAGTGHEGSEALITSEYRPDSSVWSNGFDAFGDARKLTDGLSRITTQSFDKAGRVTQITRPATAAGTLIESFSYDGLGRKVRAWSAELSSPTIILQETTTDYDALGRVVSQRGPGNASLTGDLTTISYVWNAALATTGLATFGGWEETTTYANGKTMISTTDAFGRELFKQDMGLHQFTIGYDAAGRMVSRTGSGGASGSLASGSQSYTYFNTGQLSGIAGDYGAAQYGYDAGGNRISESATSASGAQITNATASYDAMNRITNWTETGSATTPAASTSTQYDANGNIRRTQASYGELNANGNLTGTTQLRDYWYRFDAMNRVVADKGYLSGTAGAVGTTIKALRTYGYDDAGQRVFLQYEAGLTGYKTEWVWREGYGPGSGGLVVVQEDGVNGDYLPVAYTYYGDKRELFTYTATGQVEAVTTQEHGYTVNGSGMVVSNGAFGPASSPISTFQYDLLGRQVQQTDGGTFSRSLTYNAKNQILVDSSTTLRLRSNGGSDTFQTITRNDYDADGDLDTGSGSTYALGSIVWQHAQQKKNGNDGDQDDTMLRFNFAWWDGAVQSTIQYDAKYFFNNQYNATNNAFNVSGSAFDIKYTTQFAINGFGQTTSAAVRDGVAKNLAYTLDAAGQIAARKETRVNVTKNVVGAITGETVNSSEAAPRELYYRFAGKQMGMVGNNGTDDVNYTQSISNRMAASPDITSTNAGLFRNGTNTGSVGYADFALAVDAYNSNSQGSAGGGTYTVRTGDTLQAIAAALYGDGNLWYRIAEANGLSAGAALSEGQSLILPSGVTKSTHNASTFQPYDAAEAMGDTLPTTPKPPKTPKCGVFGQILSTLVAIAASQFLGPVFGNLVSQGFNMVIGIQSKFSWKSLGMSVASAVVTAGMNGAFAGVQSAFLQGALQQATASALTQGIGVATGLQKKFDFAGIAAAGVAGGVSGWAGARLGERTSNVDKTVWRNGDLTKNGAFLANSAGAIAEAATRSAIKGNSFGDNLLASLPSVIGRAALDGAGAKSILGDGWLGTALADPGSVLPKGWITNAANSVISTVGNVMADMVRGNGAQGGGGGAIGTYASMRFAGSPFDPTNLGMVTHARKNGVITRTPSGIKFDQLAVEDLDDLYGSRDRLLEKYTDPRDRKWIRQSAALIEQRLQNNKTEITPNDAPPEDWIVVTGAKVRRDTPVDASAQRMQAYADNYAAKVDAYESVNGIGSYERDIRERITLREAAEESIRSQARGVTNSTFGGFYLGTISAATLPLSLSTGGVLWGGLGTYGGIENASRGANMVFNGRERGILAYGFNEASGTGGENLGVGDYMSFSVDAANLGKASYEVGKLGYGAYKNWRGVDRFVAGLRRFETPSSTLAGRFEIEQAGAYNYRVSGGGTAIDIDGYRGSTLLDAKFVSNASSSPYVNGSNVPSFLREKILQEQIYEIQRYGAVIADPNVPFKQLNILTNEPLAIPYFKDIMIQHKVPGSVKVVPTKVR